MLKFCFGILYPVLATLRQNPLILQESIRADRLSLGLPPGKRIAIYTAANTRTLYAQNNHVAKTQSLHFIQYIPATLAEAWDFFSRPGNLPYITPPGMDFTVISKHHGEHMYTGQIIEYKLRPLLNIPMYWMTEITHVEPLRYFIDEQRFGPYQLWHHQHHFKEVEGGVEMTDLVHYRLPFWFIGNLVDALVVRKQLNEIFRFRKEAVEKRFGMFQKINGG